jgi:polysaccharide biosynthesis protein PslH
MRKLGVVLRLLVVLSSNLFPSQIGGAIFTYNSIKQISKNHFIYILYLDKTINEDKLSKFAEDIYFIDQINKSTVKIIILNILKKICYIINILFIFFKIPYYLPNLLSFTINNQIIDFLKYNKFDAILLYETSMIQFCPPSTFKKLIVNVEDPQSIKFSRMIKLPIWSFLQKIKLFYDTKLIERYEKKFFPKIAKVLFLSEADMEDMRKLYGYGNLGTVSYGVNKNSEEEIMGYEERTDGMIVFSGNMFHPPNVDGALFFLNDIFPLVLQQYSKAILWIVGAKPDRRIQISADCFGEHVVITGWVNDISKYLQRSRVSICPVRLGIGVQTKILEALSWGTPVITTSAGNRGIGGSSGSELWVEDQPNMFADRVVSLLFGEDWNRLSREGRKFVENRFSWERSAMDLDKYIVHI